VFAGFWRRSDGDARYECQLGDFSWHVRTGGGCRRASIRLGRIRMAESGGGSDRPRITRSHERPEVRLKTKHRRKGHHMKNRNIQSKHAGLLIRCSSLLCGSVYSAPNSLATEPATWALPGTVSGYVASQFRNGVRAYRHAIKFREPRTNWEPSQGRRISYRTLATRSGSL